MYNTDIAIIGAGPSGLFAIFQAGMLGMKCHIIDNLEMIGGQCSALYPEKPIYDIPAYPLITAAELILQLEKQAAAFKPIYHLNQQVNKLEKLNDEFILSTNKGIAIKAKVIIIAAGSGSFGPNKPPLQNIEDFEEKSVFYLVKRKSDFLGKKIVIAGGGDSAVDWAISLAEIAEKIYLVHRRDKFRAMDSTVNQLKEIAKTGKVELVIGYQLSKLLGDNGQLEAVILEDFNGDNKTLQAEILLPFFGLSQNLGPILDFGLNIKLNHIQVNHATFETNEPGIYAIGDVATYDGKLKLILTSFAEAAHAIHHAYKRVFNGKALHFEYSTTKGVSSI